MTVELTKWRFQKLRLKDKWLYTLFLSDKRVQCTEYSNFGDDSKNLEAVGSRRALLELCLYHVTKRVVFRFRKVAILWLWPFLTSHTTDGLHTLHRWFSTPSNALAVTEWYWTHDNSRIISVFSNYIMMNRRSPRWTRMLHCCSMVSLRRYIQSIIRSLL